MQKNIFVSEVICFCSRLFLILNDVFSILFAERGTRLMLSSYLIALKIRFYFRSFLKVKFKTNLIFRFLISEILHFYMDYNYLYCNQILSKILSCCLVTTV